MKISRRPSFRVLLISFTIDGVKKEGFVGFTKRKQPLGKLNQQKNQLKICLTKKFFPQLRGAPYRYVQKSDILVSLRRIKRLMT